MLLSDGVIAKSEMQEKQDQCSAVRTQDESGKKETKASAMM